MKTPEKVWQEYYSGLYAFVRGRVSDDMARDDILQEVFLKMYTGLASVKDETKLKSWLYRIARNSIIDYYRSRVSAVDIPECLSRSETDPRERTAQVLSECLRPMIETLPEHYREAVVLSELEGLTQREVARMQGISVSGAKSRVQRGRVMLKEILDECCRFEFDHSGRLYDYERRNGASDNS